MRTQNIVNVPNIPLVKQAWVSLIPGTANQPLFISVHGLGETNNITRTGNVSAAGHIAKGNMPETFTVNGQTYSPAIISPCLTSNDRGGYWLDAFIDWCVRTYNCDATKIYLIGLSQGGGGIYYYLTTTKWSPGGFLAYGAKRIAAAVPIAGNYPYNALYAAIIRSMNTHLWIIGNSGDNVVPIDVAQGWFKTMEAVLPDPLTKLTVFNAAGHNSWDHATDPAFKENGLNIYEWSLQYEKDAKGITIADGTSVPDPEPNPNPIPTPEPEPIPEDIVLDVAVSYSDVCDATKGRKLLTFDMSKSTAKAGLDTYGFSCDLISGPGGYTGGGVKSVISLCIAPGKRTFRVGCKDKSGKKVSKDVEVEVV